MIEVVIEMFPNSMVKIDGVENANSKNPLNPSYHGLVKNYFTENSKIPDDACYGFIANTLEADGDPLDCYIILKDKIDYVNSLKMSMKKNLPVVSFDQLDVVGFIRNRDIKENTEEVVKDDKLVLRFKEDKMTEDEIKTKVSKIMKRMRSYTDEHLIPEKPVYPIEAFTSPMSRSFVYQNYPFLRSSRL